MADYKLEGSLVLEKLSEIGKVDDFYDAIDLDDFVKAKTLLKLAGLDSETIKMTLEEIKNAAGEN